MLFRSPLTVFFVPSQTAAGITAVTALHTRTQSVCRCAFNQRLLINWRLKQRLNLMIN